MKFAKCQDLVEAFWRQGWQACRPSSGRRLQRLCRSLTTKTAHHAGSKWSAERTVTRVATDAAERASRRVTRGQRGVTRELTLLGCQPGSDQSWLGRPDEGVWCCKTQNIQLTQDTVLIHPSASVGSVVHLAVENRGSFLKAFRQASNSANETETRCHSDWCSPENREHTQQKLKVRLDGCHEPGVVEATRLFDCHEAQLQ